MCFYPHESSEVDAPAREIAYRGAAAVSALIELLNDHRLTAHWVGGDYMSRPQLGRVGELAELLLKEITGINSYGNQKTSSEIMFRKWLAKEQEIGEEAMLVDSVFTRTNGRITWVNETPARIVARKFPDSLASLCDEFTKNATDEAVPWPLSDALATSALPTETQVKVLASFAQKGSLGQQRYVLQSLVELDEKRTAELLAPVLDEMPRDSTGSYWTCPEAGFTYVVKQIENDDIWRRYVQVAKRSRVGLRMEMMNSMDYVCVGGKCMRAGKNRDRRLAFLAAFLTDKSVRKIGRVEGKFDGPCAAFTIPKIAVRDFAAMKIASILGLPESPDEFWTSAQWKELRQKVTEKLCVEKLPDYASPKHG